jgi:hypothetical protein
MISYRPIAGNRFAICCDQFIILIVKTEAEAKAITQPAKEQA